MGQAVMRRAFLNPLIRIAQPASNGHWERRPLAGMRAGRPRFQAAAIPQPRNRQQHPCTVRLSTHFGDFLSGD